MKRLTIPAIALVLSVAPAFADEGCKYDTDTNVISYTSVIGADACATYCAETEGCIAWSFQPHNKSPDKVATTCLAFDKIGERQMTDRHHCGLAKE